MSATRCFVDGVHQVDDVVALRADDARKLVVVLRRRAGDALEIRDSSGNRFEAELTFDGDAPFARLVAIAERGAEEACEIVLAQAIPKGAKMEFVVEKCTELGVAGILPVRTERTVATAEGGKVERWRRVARTSAAQCGRERIPFIAEPMDLETALASPHDRALIPWELAERAPLRRTLPDLVADVRRVLVLIGPEGGFAATEIALARAAGAVPLSLGRRILRTETAGAICLALIRYQRDEL